MDTDTEECEHEWEYTSVVYMGTDQERWVHLCVHCDEEDDSESYYGD